MPPQASLAVETVHRASCSPLVVVDARSRVGASALAPTASIYFFTASFDIASFDMASFDMASFSVALFDTGS